MICYPDNFDAAVKALCGSGEVTAGTNAVDSLAYYCSEDCGRRFIFCLLGRLFLKGMRGSIVWFRLL